LCEKGRSAGKEKEDKENCSQGDRRQKVREEGKQNREEKEEEKGDKDNITEGKKYIQSEHA